MTPLHWSPDLNELRQNKKRRSKPFKESQTVLNKGSLYRNLRSNLRMSTHRQSHIPRPATIDFVPELERMMRAVRRSVNRES